jgi:hypothetical protein
MHPNLPRLSSSLAVNNAMVVSVYYFYQQYNPDKVEFDCLPALPGFVGYQNEPSDTAIRSLHL